MTVFTPTGSSQVTVTPNPPTGNNNPTVVNIPIISSVESSYVFPDGTTSYLIKTREGQALQVAFVSGDTAVNYFTVPRGNFLSDSGLLTSGLTIYFQASTDCTVEMLTWS